MTEARLPPGPVTDPIGPREGGGGTAAEGLDSVCVGETRQHFVTTRQTITINFLQGTNLNTLYCTHSSGAPKVKLCTLPLWLLQVLAVPSDLMDHAPCCYAFVLCVGIVSSVDRQ